MKYPKVKIAFGDKKEETVVIDKFDLVDCSEDKVNSGMAGPTICVRTSGNLDGKGYLLSPMYTWVIVQDDKGCIVLVPVKKGR